MTQIDRRAALLSLATASVAIPAILTAFPALAQTTPAEGSGDQSDYVKQTLTVGTVALKTSEIAAEKATDPMVKEFATLEVAEQKTIASILSATEAGKTPPELPAEEQAKIDDLNAKEAGPEFDAAYIDGQIEGHNKLLQIQQTISGETEATVEAITARLAEQAVTSHLAMLNHIKSELGQSGGAPATGGDQPAAAGDQPAAGGDQPAGTGDQPAAGGDQPAATGDQPAAGGNAADPNAAATGQGGATPSN